MQKKYEIAGSVMGFFDSFKGSRPAIDNDKILIVRGRSRKALPIDELENKVLEIGKKIGGEEIPETSPKIGEILKSGDRYIQGNEMGDLGIDSTGFSRAKQEFELIGLVAVYKVFELPNFNVVIAIWEDRNEIPPLFVEVTVSEKNKESEK